MQVALPMAPAQDLQCLALQRMASSNNPNTVGIAVEVMMVGSVSSVRSTRLTTSGCYGWSRIGLPTEGFCGLFADGFELA
jgi:hypothetical protein